MAVKADIKKFPWIGTGVAVILFIMFLALNIQTWQSHEQLLFKARRVELVARMRLALTSSAEAEKSAVMAVTDKDSQVFADQSRSAALEAGQELKELSTLLAPGTRNEKDLLDQFSKAFAGLQSIDNGLLALAVRNTNIKAYNLAFGPAADALKGMYTALSKLTAKSAGSPNAEKIALLVLAAQSSALRIQTMLAPHIAEENDRKMDELEAQMTAGDKKVHECFAGLDSLPEFNNDTDLKTAALDYDRFSSVRQSILKFSRENTNVKSLAISLGEKRKAFLLCQDLLSSLQQAIQSEIIPVPAPASTPSIQTPAK